VVLVNVAPYMRKLRSASCTGVQVEALELFSSVPIVYGWLVTNWPAALSYLPSSASATACTASSVSSTIAYSTPACR